MIDYKKNHERSGSKQDFENFILQKKLCMDSITYLIEGTKTGQLKWPGCNNSIVNLNLTYHDLWAYQKNLKNALMKINSKNSEYITDLSHIYQFTFNLYKEEDDEQDLISVISNIFSEIKNHDYTLVINNVVAYVVDAYKKIKDVYGFSQAMKFGFVYIKRIIFG